MNKPINLFAETESELLYQLIQALKDEGRAVEYEIVYSSDGHLLGFKIAEKAK